MDEHVYTIREVAEKLKLTRESVLRLLHRRELIGFKAGRDWRIKASALEYYMSKRAEINRRPPQSLTDLLDQALEPRSGCTRDSEKDQLHRETRGRAWTPPEIPE